MKKIIFFLLIFSLLGFSFAQEVEEVEVEDSPSIAASKGGYAEVPPAKRPKAIDQEKAQAAAEKDETPEDEENNRNTIRYGLPSEIGNLLDTLLKNDDPRFTEEIYDLFQVTKSPVIKEKIRVFIKRLNKEKKTTIFLTSHDVGDIEKLCKRVIIINNGKIVLDDSMENLKYHYLDKKIVEAKMNTKINLDDVDGITILKDKDYNLKIEVDLKKKSITDAIKLLDPDKIIDINISNTPLESIISSIYQKKDK